MANRYGLDSHYISKNLKILLRDVESYPPDEMRRSLMRLASTCLPVNSCPACESKNTRLFSADDNQCADCKKIYSVC